MYKDCRTKIRAKMKDIRVITIILLIGLCFFLYFNKKDINFEKDLYDDKMILFQKEKDSLNLLYFNSKIIPIS